MPVRWSDGFLRDWSKLPDGVKTKARRIIRNLDSNRKHPSLRLKKLQRVEGYWELRVDRAWRILLTIEGDTYLLVVIGKHEVLDKFGRN